VRSLPSGRAYPGEHSHAGKLVRHETTIVGWTCGGVSGWKIESTASGIFPDVMHPGELFGWAKFLGMSPRGKGKKLLRCRWWLPVQKSGTLT